RPDLFFLDHDVRLKMMAGPKKRPEAAQSDAILWQRCVMGLSGSEPVAKLPVRIVGSSTGINHHRDPLYPNGQVQRVEMPVRRGLQITQRRKIPAQEPEP